MQLIDTTQNKSSCPEIQPNQLTLKEIIMNTFAKTAALVATIAAANFGIGAAYAVEGSPYIWTTGDAGLIANPAVKYNGPADKSTGLFAVGVGEQGLIANPAFKDLPTTQQQALFAVGVGEQGLVDIKQPINYSKMAAKLSTK
jgi:hypothetical protein